MKNKYRELISNIGIFTIANFTTKLLGFFILPLYTYYLSTEEYGTIDLINTIIQLLFPFLSLSITDAVLRFSISKRDKKNEIFSIGFKIICAGSVLLAVLCCGASRVVSDKYVLVAFVAIYFLQALNTLFGAFAKAIDKTKEMVIITVLTSLSILLLNVVFVAFLQKGMHGYLLSMALGNAIGVALYVLICKLHKYFVTRFDSFDVGLIKELTKYSIPLIPNALFWWINSSLDRWALTVLSGLSVVGLYAAANRIPTILSTISSIFNQAWNLSLFRDSDDKERRAFFLKTYFYYNEIIFCCSLFIIMVTKPLARILFSKGFFEAWIYVPLLTVGMYYNSLNGVIGALFTAEKKTKHIFSTTAIGSCVNALFNFVFISIIGPLGAAVATVLSYFVVFIARVCKVDNMFSVTIDKKRICLQFSILFIMVLLATMDCYWPLVIVLAMAYCLKTGIQLLALVRG